MSYNLGLKDAITGECLDLEQPHQMRGGTYAIGGTATADFNITYNYAKHFYRVFDPREVPGSPYSDDKYGGRVGGLRSIYGLTGAESIPVLQKAIDQFGDDVSSDYWEGTEGNAKRSLQQCLALAQMRPDGVWDGD